MQTPPLHVDVPPQTLPHAPQFWLFEPVLTQPPLQSVKPPVHMPPQAPMLQTSVPPAGGGGQALPQRPQLVRSA